MNPDIAGAKIILQQRFCFAQQLCFFRGWKVRPWCYLDVSVHAPGRTCQADKRTNSSTRPPQMGGEVKKGAKIEIEDEAKT